MNQNRVYDIEESNFTATRRELTKGVSGYSLLPQDSLVSNLILTRVQPGSVFHKHRDSYHHLFYIMKGEGEIRLGDGAFKIKPGRVVEVLAGEAHGYENMTDDEILILTINIKC